MSDINWDKYKRNLEGIIEEASERTNTKLANEVAKISRLTNEEVKRLFPEPSDAQRVAELMEIVRRSGNRNEKINSITRNADRFGNVIFTLLDKLA